MNYKIKRNIAIVLAVAMVLPLFSSCSLFSKKAILEEVTEFGDALKSGNASDILQETDGLDREYKKSFKQLLDLKNYTEEEARAKLSDDALRAIASRIPLEVTQH